MKIILSLITMLLLLPMTVRDGTLLDHADAKASWTKPARCTKRMAVWRRWAGIAYTREHGPLLFAIYDMAESHNVMRLGCRQDEFLKNLIRELDGPKPLPPRPEGKADETAEPAVNRSLSNNDAVRWAESRNRI